MADVKWIKIVTDIFDDEKILLIESMPEADGIIVIWFKLLCLAGRQNNSGVFLMNGRIPYTDEMFATIFRRPLNTVRMALRTFEMYGMIEIINDTVTIPNWGKHQSIEQIEARREYQRKYHQEYRRKQKLLTEGEAVEADKDLRKRLRDDLRKSAVNAPDKIREDKNREDKNEIILGLFERFWKEYPRKVSKPAALRAWKGLKADAALTDRIIADVKRRCDTEWKGQAIQYIPHPSTYLNQRRWEDETAPTERKDATHRGIDPQDNPALNFEQREYKDEDFGDDFFIDLDKYGEGTP